jgi:O-antigen ligase
MIDRYAVRVLLAVGAITVVLAAAPYRLFDLDRFFAPKELLLHLAALALVLLGLRRVKTLEFSVTDLLLVLYLSLSCVSALFAADHWLATRALAITLSGAGIFWAARNAADAGARRTIVAAVAAAAVVGAAASLAQAYGFTSELFSLNRVPGGTLGNRNFMAHLAAICAPALVLAAVRARRTWTAAAGFAGLAILADALVLSRSRAAYLGLAAGAGLLAFGFWRAHGRWNDQKLAFRMKTVALAAALVILAAVTLPNTLEWKSDSPYLDTVTGVVNYQKGSGHGRLVQYSRTLRIAAAHPLLGVGPGNWPLAYPKFVEDFDRSIDYNRGRTTNPWPSSDWAAIVSERGLAALAAILLFFLGLLIGAWRRAEQAAEIDDYLEGLTLAAALAAAAVVSCFDAVLLLPAPSFIAWALFGALAASSPALRAVTLSPRARRRLTIAVALAGTAAVLRSSGQIAAMALYSRAHTAAQFRHAALLDPGSDRIRARAAALQNR